MATTKPGFALIDGASINVLDYGAVGDGATDDTAAIQAAMDAAVAAGGSTVRIPAGSYNVGSPLIHKSSAVPIKLLGDGNRKSLLVATAAFDTILLLTGEACASANISSLPSAGFIDSFTIQDGGYYDTAPTAIVTGTAGATPPTVTPVLTGNKVTSVTIDTAGTSDFTAAWIEFDVNKTTLVERTSNVATVTTSGVHLLTTGDLVQITGTTADSGSFNTAYVSVTVTSTTEFTYASTGGDIGSTAETDGLTRKQHSYKSLGLHVEEIGFSTFGYSTHCVKAERGSWQFVFDKCRFVGNQAASIFDIRGDFANIQNCIFAPSGATTVGLNITARGIDSHIAHNRFGGIGRGIRIDTLYAGQNPTAGGSINRPQGITFLDNHMICTGTWNFFINQCLYIDFTENWIVESATYQVYIAGLASNLNFIGGYIGGTTGAVCAYIESTVGNDVSFTGVNFNIGTYGIRCVAAGSDILDGLRVTGCGFMSMSVVSIRMDSVTNAVISNNIDRGTPSSGSWYTEATVGSGSYSFNGNSWHTADPGSFDTGAEYHWGNDTGIVMKNSGVKTSTTGTSDTITHGLTRTPTIITATPYDADAGSWFFSTPGGTTAAINWKTSSAPKWSWMAEV